VSRRRYVETSALLRVLLDGDAGLQPEISGEGLVTSALTFVEAARAIVRARRWRRLDARAARDAERLLKQDPRARSCVAGCVHVSQALGSPRATPR